MQSRDTISINSQELFEKRIETLKKTQRPVRILSLGWGVQSTTLAVMAARGQLEVDFMIHADTTYESVKTYAYAQELSKLLTEGVVITTTDTQATQGQGSHEWNGTNIPAFTIDAEGSRGQLRRQCTDKWKILPIRRATSMILKALHKPKSPGAVQQMLGITTDEWQRAKDSGVQYVENVYPLLDQEMSRGDCIRYLEKHSIPVPPKSACVFCPYHSKKAWQEIKKENGPDWELALSVDEEIRDQRPPDPLFVHEARLPLAEAVTIPEDHGYTQNTLFDLESAPCDSGYCFI